LNKPPLLFLVHRIPYPPNKGDKIRSFHLLKYLSLQYDVHVGTFIDDPFDRQYMPNVERYAASTCCLTLNSRWAKLKSVSGLLTGLPLTLPYYASRAMQRWAAETQKRYAIQHILVFSSSMAQFVPAACLPQTVVDFVDIDSDKWCQYAEKQRFPMRWIYRRECQKLFAYEQTISRASKKSLFVSQTEAACFQQKLPDIADKIGYFNNGVDVDYFDPEQPLDNPFPTGSIPIVFTGAMDYWANVEGVMWFVESVLPLILSEIPKAVFYIVGGNPSDDVLRLRSQTIEVTGRVPDVRPYLKYAHVIVAPLRIARGIQNKVLEAMSMDQPVVVTPQAQEGILDNPFLQEHCDAEPEGFAQACVSVLRRDSVLEPGSLRRFILTHYHWQSCIDDLIQAIATE